MQTRKQMKKKKKENQKKKKKLKEMEDGWKSSGPTSPNASLFRPSKTPQKAVCLQFWRLWAFLSPRIPFFKSCVVTFLHRSDQKVEGGKLNNCNNSKNNKKQKTEQETSNN